MADLSREQQEEIAKKDRLTNKDFTLVYDAYHQRIFNFINSRITKREDAEDLTSLVFEKVLKKLQDFQWQGISITSWIYRIARNVIIDFYRKNNERTKDSSLEDVGEFLVSADIGLEDLIVNGEEEIKLFNALREFEEDEQFLIYYKFFEDMSNQQISELTSLSETNVGTKLHRIRLKLAKIIES